MVHRLLQAMPSDPRGSLSPAAAEQQAELFSRLAALAPATPSTAWEASISSVASALASVTTSKAGGGVSDSNIHLPVATSAVVLRLSALRLASTLAAHHPGLMQRVLSTVTPGLIASASDPNKEVRGLILRNAAFHTFDSCN